MYTYNTIHILYNDGKVQYYTNCNKDISYDNIIYKGKTKFEIINEIIHHKKKYNFITIGTIINDNFISKEDIKNNNINSASIEIGIVKNENHNLIFKGNIINLESKDNLLMINAVSNSYCLQQNIGRNISNYCKASLFDNNCKVIKKNFQFHCTVTHITNHYTIKDHMINKPVGFFVNGSIQFSSGENTGLSYQVIKYNNQCFFLDKIVENKIEIGDNFIATIGCNKSFGECIYKFNNSENFFGFPFIKD